MSQELFSHAAPIFSVPNVQEAAEYYRDQLGFTIEFLWEDPPSYAVLRRGEGVSVHLSQHDGTPRPALLYLFVHDPDAVYKEYREKGVNLITEIGDRDYRMRDFDLEDPWSNRITIGKGI